MSSFNLTGINYEYAFRQLSICQLTNEIFLDSSHIRFRAVFANAFFPGYLPEIDFSKFLFALLVSTMLLLSLDDVRGQKFRLNPRALKRKYRQGLVFKMHVKCFKSMLHVMASDFHTKYHYKKKYGHQWINRKI